MAMVRRVLSVCVCVSGACSREDEGGRGAGARASRAPHRSLLPPRPRPLPGAPSFSCPEATV
eukprot:1641835-Rhodomonas_salina.1